MRRVPFGKTGMDVSVLSFGTMTLGDRLKGDDAYRVLDLSLERGVNFFDCANMYNGGRSEQILGEWFNAHGCREDILVSSKVRYQVGDDESSKGLTPDNVSRQLERSLRRLATDHLDN